MKLRTCLFPLLAGLAFLVLPACSMSPRLSVINARDYGAISDDGKNDLEPLRQALALAIKTGHCRLVVPPGRYDLAEADAVKLQDDVLSGRLGNPQDRIFNRDFKYVTALDFTGAEQVVVEARGVEFLIDGWMEPVSLQRCRGVTINGLTIDYKRPPNSEGKIIAVGNGTVDVKFADWCPVTTALPFVRLMIYDEAKQSLCGESIYHHGMQLIAPQTLRFNLRSGQCQVGRILSGLHGFHFRPAILLYEARDTVLNDVTIYAQPGMGIVGHLSENLTMNRLRIVPRAGRHVSSNTDATHFVSCRGLFRFYGCEFGGQGDDSTNLHCFYTDIRARLPGNRCVLDITRRFETHSVKRDYPRVGDTLAVVKRSTLEEVGYLQVKSVELSNQDWSYTVTYEGKLPEDFQNYTVADITASPALEFINCTVRSHRARSVLVKTRNVRIEGCTFENTTGTAIHIGAEGNWMEGVASADVVIRRNKITNCGLGGANDGTIDDASGIAVHVNAADRSIPGLHKRLLFEDNEINGGRHAITIKGAEDVTIRHNVFKNITAEPIVVGSSRRVRAYDNQGAAPIPAEIPKLPPPPAGLKIQPISGLDLSLMSVGNGKPLANRSLGGGPLQIAGTQFSSGIASHAASDFFISLDGNARSFRAVCGIDDDSLSTNASVRFHVSADGKLMWSSPVMKAGMPGVVLDLPLQGVRLLRLQIDDGGDGISSDHADWAGATIFYQGQAPTAIPAPPPPPRGNLAK